MTKILKTVLIIDNEINIIKLLKHNLENNGYKVLYANNGEDGLELIFKNDIDIILLDIILPDINGLDILKSIRSNPIKRKIPIIMITSKNNEFDKVLGFEMGADDYILKPFSIKELQARLKAILRRVGYNNNSYYKYNDKIITHNLEIDLKNRVVTMNNNIIKLSHKEFEILKLLAENSGKVYSRFELLEKIWGYKYLNETRTIDVHIRHIRKKIEIDDKNPIFIKTVRGYGYKFIEIE